MVEPPNMDRFGTSHFALLYRGCPLFGECTSITEKGPQIVSFIERFFFYCVLCSECPLSEVLLYVDGGFLVKPLFAGPKCRWNSEVPLYIYSGTSE